VEQPILAERTEFSRTARGIQAHTAMSGTELSCRGERRAKGAIFVVGEADPLETQTHRATEVMRLSCREGRRAGCAEGREG